MTNRKYEWSEHMPREIAWSDDKYVPSDKLLDLCAEMEIDFVGSRIGRLLNPWRTHPLGSVVVANCREFVVIEEPIEDHIKDLFDDTERNEHG